MTKQATALSRLALASFLAFGAMSTLALAGDLSRYRSFQLGTDLPTVALQAGASLSQVKVIQSRPALIQELQLRLQPLSPTSQAESVDDIVFSFYNGVLYRIAVNYDRHETEGLTADDFIEALSTTYGIAERPAAQPSATQVSHGDGEVLARWQNAEHGFELIRSPFAPVFRLAGILKRVDALAQASTLEAARLDKQEAPQRDAERMASEQQTELARLEKARLVNKPKFQP